MKQSLKTDIIHNGIIALAVTMAVLTLTMSLR